jgi:hypothetical protein
MNRLLLVLGALSLSGCATFHPVTSFRELTPGDVAEVRFAAARNMVAASSTPLLTYPLAAVDVVRGPVLAIRGDTLMLNVTWVGSPTRPHRPAADARLFLVPEPTMEVGIRRNDRWRVAGVVALSGVFLYALVRVAGADVFHTGFAPTGVGAP